MQNRYEFDMDDPLKADQFQKKLDDLEATLSRRMNQGFDLMNQMMDSLKTRVTRLEEKVHTMCPYSDNIDDMDQRVQYISRTIRNMNECLYSNLSLIQRVREIRSFLNTHTLNDFDQNALAERGTGILEKLVDEGFADETQDKVSARLCKYWEAMDETEDSTHLSEIDRQIGYAFDCLINARMKRLLGFYPVSFDGPVKKKA